MKIIYLHQYFITLNKAGGTRPFEFAKKLVEMGHEVDVITSIFDPVNKKDWYQTYESGINVHWLPLRYSNYTSYLQRLIIFIIFAFKSYFRIKKISGDIIFASSTPLTVAIPAILHSKQKDIPLIFEVRDLWPDVPIAMKILKNPIIIFFSKLLEKITYKNSNAIIALSPEMKDGIIKKKVDPNKVAVIPNSSDLDYFKLNKKKIFEFRDKRLWLKNRPLLIYTGAFGRVNDLAYLIQLGKELLNINPEIRILLIGDGIEKNKLVYMAKKNGVYNKNLFFENPIPKKDIPVALSAANIASNIVIDIKENWANSANKFFDCLAASKPIFLNHGGWMQDLVLKYNCGLCAYGKKIEVVAQELNSVISNKSWLKSRGKSSKFLAKNLFDRKIHVDQLETILTLAINNKCNLTNDITKKFFN